MDKETVSFKSFGSKVGSFFSFLFSGIILILGFLITTPLFILGILKNWFKMSIAFAIFWFIADTVYSVVVLNAESINPFTGLSVFIIIIFGLIASLFVTIEEIKH